MADVTRRLSHFAAGLAPGDLPPALVERAKSLTLDFCGSIVRADREAESTPSLYAARKTLGLDGPGASRVVGSGRGFSPLVAAAVMLDSGSFGWDDYRRLGEPFLDALSDLVDVVRDETLEGLRHPFGATLKVETASGTIERRIADPSGEPGTFLDEGAVRGKFALLAEPVLGIAAERLADLVLSLDRRNALDLAA